MFENDNESLNIKFGKENRKLQDALGINQRLLAALDQQKDKYSTMKRRNRLHSSSSGSLGIAEP